MITLTGKELNYLHICKRKLWLFHHGIRPEMEYGNVQIGINIGERAFRREEKEIPLDDIGVLDWADFADGIIHETKKSAYSIADQAQVRYYLKVLREHGVNVRTAVIHYPTLRKQIEVDWNDRVATMVESDLAEARNVIEQSVPDTPERRTICKRCAYEEVCFA